MLPLSDSSAPAPIRMSPYALWGSLLSVGSLAACLVAAILAMLATPKAAVVVLVLPLISGAGAALSALALREINRAGGTIVGKPIAIVGLFVGLTAAIIQGAAVLSALGSAWAVKANLVPVVEAFMLAHARNDRAAMRAALGDTVSRHLDDARIDWFFTQLDARLGEVQGARFDLGVMMRATTRLQQAAAGATPGKTIIENPKPVELVFTRGAVLAFVIPDDEAMRVQQRIAVSDILVMIPGPAVLTLRRDGPATALSNRFGWTIIEPASSP
ncbi:MAG: hypothetical protein JNK58_09670 [Phycisphaerae bacterium]|nr:hypothetical protein [Phycisphaerae bacterium]